MKIILAPDSFKGSLSAQRFCMIANSVIKYYLPHAEIINLPLADGGEGTVAAVIQIMGGKIHKAIVSDPWGDPIEAAYGLLSDEQTAIIEIASAAGLTLVGSRLDPSHTSTYGVGELMAHILDQGVKRILIGLGGSATNDGGCGMAAALGIRFLNKMGESFIPIGENLTDIVSIDISQRHPRLDSCLIEAISDVNSPLYGPLGAAATFGPQKGADALMVKELDLGLQHLAKCLISELNINVADIPGSGAAGGLGAALIAFTKGKIHSGIETILKLAKFDLIAMNADLLITGEGRLDASTLQGKAIHGLIKHAQLYQLPVVAFVGDYTDEALELVGNGLNELICTNWRCLEISEAMQSIDYDLAFIISQFAPYIKQFISKNYTRKKVKK